HNIWDIILLKRKQRFLFVKTLLEEVVSPTRFELISSEPESEILSIELRRLRWQKYYFLPYFKIEMKNINANVYFLMMMAIFGHQMNRYFQIQIVRSRKLGEVYIVPIGSSNIIFYT